MMSDDLAYAVARLIMPRRMHPYGTGWGGGNLEWVQKEAFEIRYEAEVATADAIMDVLSEDES